ncbi:MAG: dephospho-CoA kinase [Deltaproteobacteria bacterium]|nr:dephospho-CoA kinase [Deltaproteobacteria bacterium]
MNIGLTGGIGSGKSTVDGLFRGKGAYIIDFDTLAHEAEAPGSPAWKEIVAYFGRDILNNDDTINRERLGNIVFRDREKLEKLNSIVHPSVFDEWKRKVEEIRLKRDDAIIISDIPLLIEVRWYKYVDVVILVYISPEEQMKRMMKRNGYSRHEAMDRLNSQMPIDEKVPYANFIVHNEGSVEETKKIVDDIWLQLLEREKEKRNT